MKPKLYVLVPFFILISGYYSFSQVGIGTTNPNATSMLDISSTTRGMLTPRMTTIERNAITSPAHGLLVFDTDENGFYYYNSTAWVPISSNTGALEQRTNFKLIQAEADLSDELANGGGSTYMLDTNTYYEVNGTISLAAPIDLNNAYIGGLDANEDVLVNTSGHIFSGSTGGSIRNLTLVAPSSSIFNISANPAEIFVFQNSIVVNSNSLGSLSNFGVVFMNIINIVNNSNGIVFTDINNLLLSNLAWFDSNNGTFETYVGTFDLIEKISGFMKVPTGATGIDVSSNPTVNFGSIKDSPFTGLGDYVNGYTTGTYVGCNFTNRWSVDSPGIKLESDNSASADFYYTGALTTGFTQTINNNTAVNITGGGTFNSNNLFRFLAPNPGNRLVYDGLEQRQFQVNVSLSVRVQNAASNFYAYVIAKNGTPITESNSVVIINNDSQIQNIAINAITDLESGDYIEIFVQRLSGSGSDTLVVFSENVSIN